MSQNNKIIDKSKPNDFADTSVGNPSTHSQSGDIFKFDKKIESNPSQTNITPEKSGAADTTPQETRNNTPKTEETKHPDEPRPNSDQDGSAQQAQQNKESDQTEEPSEVPEIEQPARETEPEEVDDQQQEPEQQSEQEPNNDKDQPEQEKPDEEGEEKPDEADDEQAGEGEDAEEQSAEADEEPDEAGEEPGEESEGDTDTQTADEPEPEAEGSGEAAAESEATEAGTAEAGVAEGGAAETATATAEAEAVAGEAAAVETAVVEGEAAAAGTLSGGWIIALIILGILIIFFIVMMVVAIFARKAKTNKADPAQAAQISTIKTAVASGNVGYDDPSSMTSIQNGDIGIESLSTQANLSKKHTWVRFHYLGANSTYLYENQPYEFDVTEVDRIKCTDPNTKSKIIDIPIVLDVNFDWSSLLAGNNPELICAEGYYPLIESQIKGKYYDVFSPGEFKLSNIATAGPALAQEKVAEIADEVISYNKENSVDNDSDASLLPRTIQINSKYNSANLAKTGPGVKDQLTNLVNSTYANPESDGGISDSPTVPSIHIAFD